MPNNKPISAIAVFNFPNCKGTVSFTESLNDNSVMIKKCGKKKYTSKAICHLLH